MNLSIRGLALLIVALLIGCGSSGDSGLEPVGDIPVVGPILVPQEISDLRRAVASAGPGDTILIAPGTYQSDLLIDKPLVIASQGGGPVVIQTTVVPAIQFAFGSSGTVLRDLTLECVGRGLTIGDDRLNTSNITLQRVTIKVRRDATGAVAVVADLCSNLSLLDCRFESEGVGFQIGGFGTCRDSVVENTVVSLTDANAQSGALLSDAPGAQVRNLTIGAAQTMLGTPIGFQITGPGAGVLGVVIDNLRVTLPGDQTVGARLLRAPGVVLRNSVISAGFEGLTLGHLLADTGTVVGGLLENNRVSLTTTANLGAVFVVGVEQAQVTGNRIEDAAVGLRFVRYNGFVVQGNEIQRCATGLRFENAQDNAASTQQVLRNVILNCQDSMIFLGTNAAGALIANNTMVLQLRAVSSQDTFLILINNLISQATNGIINAGAQAVNLQNNIITGCQTTFLGGAVGDYNNLFQNVDGQPPLGPNGLNSINILNNDLTPPNGSPLIDGGNPAAPFNDNIPPATGTVRNDIGVYGGPFGGTIPMTILQALLNPRVQL